MARIVYNGRMNTNASVSAHSDSNPNVENLDRLHTIEMQLKRITGEYASIASEHAEMARKLAALESSGNAHRNGNGASFLEGAESTALTDRRGMMKKMAGLAAGVAAVGLLRPTSSRAGQDLQPDATGGSLILGQFNSSSGTNKTALVNPTAAFQPLVFEVENAGNTEFVQPSGSSIALASITNSAGASSVGSPQYAVYAQAQGNNPIGVYGLAGTTAVPTGQGVIGIGGIGVYGIGRIGGTGCQGRSDGSIFSYGIEGDSDLGIGGFFVGGRAAIGIGPGTGAVADPNVTNPPGFIGDIYRGSTNGSLWYRTSNSTGSYRRLADNTTAGALTAFAASSRFVNLNALGAGVTHAYQIGGVTVTGNAVPAKARAIIGRIADANPTGGGGGILVSATNPPPAGTGVLVVTAGAPQNSYFFSALDASGKLYVRNTSPSGSVDIIIDVAGYYE